MLPSYSLPSFIRSTPRHFLYRRSWEAHAVGSGWSKGEKLSGGLCRQCRSQPAYVTDRLAPPLYFGLLARKRPSRDRARRCYHWTRLTIRNLRSRAHAIHLRGNLPLRAPIRGKRAAHHHRWQTNLTVFDCARKRTLLDPASEKLA